MNKKEINRIIQFQTKELRQIFKSYDLIQGAPAGEFDGLCHKLISALHNNQDEGKIERIIESELIVTYGFTSNEIQPTEYANDVINWWNSRN